MTSVSTNTASRISLPAARLAIAASIVALMLLASLHVLSPEFDPSWRMVSEYANGRYGWILSLMFAAWGLSSWALFFAIWPEAKTTPLRIGMVVLVLAGLGEALATMFDINHDELHNLAGTLGIIGLPVAAMLITVNLGRTNRWRVATRMLLWTANLTWVTVLLLAASFVLLMVTFTQVEGALPTQPPEVLPAGVIGLVGWANRLLVVAYCLWVIIVAWEAMKLPRRSSSHSRVAMELDEIPPAPRSLVNAQ